MIFQDRQTIVLLGLLPHYENSPIYKYRKTVYFADPPDPQGQALEGYHFCIQSTAAVLHGRRGCSDPQITPNSELKLKPW